MRGIVLEAAPLRLFAFQAPVYETQGTSNPPYRNLDAENDRTFALVLCFNRRLLVVYTVP